MRTDGSTVVITHASRRAPNEPRLQVVDQLQEVDLRSHSLMAKHILRDDSQGSMENLTSTVHTVL